MKKICCIHQGAELYGSDKSFLQCVDALKDGLPDHQIDVILGGEGPLVDELTKHGHSVKVEPLWIARKAAIPVLLTIGLAKLLMNMVRYFNYRFKYDYIYINTVVIFDFILLAYLFPSRNIIHVREIPPSNFLGKLMLKLVKHSGAKLIFNSKATKQAFEPLAQGRSEVVYNGFSGPDIIPAKPDSEILNLLMVGRINSWKGQDLLLEALASLSDSYRAKIHLSIVGSVYEGQEHFRDNLVRIINENGLEDCVTLVPFTDKIGDYYANAHIAFVPSKEPEPFGRVAIEAMSYGCVVIASDGGGLSEIIEYEKSGLKFEMNSIDGLAGAIMRVVDDAEFRSNLAKGGVERYQDQFTETALKQNLVNAFGKFTEAKR